MSPFQEHRAEDSARYSATERNESRVYFFERGDNAFAPIAQIRMCRTRANCCSITPATRTLCVRGFRHRSTRFSCLANAQITDDEEFFELLLTDFFSDVRV